MVISGNVDADDGSEQANPSTKSQPDGAFLLDVLPKVVGDIETLTLKISRPHFQFQDLEMGAIRSPT